MSRSRSPSLESTPLDRTSSDQAPNLHMQKTKNNNGLLIQTIRALQLQLNGIEKLHAVKFAQLEAQNKALEAQLSVLRTQFESPKKSDTTTSASIQKVCRNGPECPFYKSGKCPFQHK